jgi:predicted transcriptional regulator
VKPTSAQNIKEKTSGGDDEKSEMLDSETEPCLMMENVLEDTQMPDSHSHNLVSSSQQMISQIEVPSEILKSSLGYEDGSFENLSQAIENRHQIELQSAAMATRTAMKTHSERNSTSDDISGHDSIGEMPSIGDFCTAQSLVDQVIEVDNMATKLLKVLRLIQIDNDNCIQELIVEK